MHYQCPLCQLPLSLNQRTFRCDNNHQFDMAKEGYVNLMPAQHKRSKDPGDNKEMTLARRLFLQSGHYEPLAQLVATTAASVTEKAGTLLDIGCGEGYYTHLTAQHTQSTCYGLDISKVAIRYAAKRYPECDFTVASSHRLPFADSSIDTLMRIYAPCKLEEMLRVLKPGGHLITVTPAPRHLYQLRELIYQQVKLHQHDESLTGFTLVDEQQLDYTMPLTGEEAIALLQMTPFAWKATEQVWQQLQQAELFKCEASFALHLYQKPLD